MAGAAMALPVVVVVAVDPSGWYPFGPGKWAAVTVCVALLIVGLANAGTVKLPRFPMVLWAVLLLTALAATAVGIDPRYGWLGTPERHFGWLTWALVAVCFVCGAQLTEIDVRAVARGASLAAVWAGGYSLVELWWGAPVDVAGSTSRLGGPFGSAAYLGAASSLLVPIAAGVALDRSGSRWWRVVGAAGAATGAVALVGAGSRAAWLGAAAGVLVLVAVSSNRRVVAVSTAVLGIVGVLLLASRIGELTERSHGAASRLDEWRVAIRVVGQHPVLGVGPEGYRVAFPSAVDAGYVRRYGGEVVADRAHSGPLDVAATLGIPAALVWVALVGMVAAGCWRWARCGPVRAGVAAGLVAYFTGQLLVFPIAELDPFAWLLAGAVVADGARRVVRVALPRRHVFVATAAVITAVAAVLGATDVAADRIARRAADAIGSAAAADEAARAADLRPDVFRLHLLEAATAEATGTLAGVDRALDALDVAARWAPGDPVVLRRGAQYLLHRAEITGSIDDVNAAFIAYRHLVAADPNCFACQLDYGRAAALADDVPAATAAWQTAASLTDNNPRPAALLAELAEATS